MRWPTSDHRVSSPYGYRTHPITGVSKLHAGADFPYPGLGAPLHAIGDFKVVEVSYNSVGGHIIKIRLDDGVIAGYFHMRERSHLDVGDIGSEGWRVGYMGNSGGSTGPHLHFETRRANGSSFDPIPYLQQGTAAGGGSTPLPNPPAPLKLGDEDMRVVLWKENGSLLAFAPGQVRVFEGAELTAAARVRDVTGRDETTATKFYETDNTGIGGLCEAFGVPFNEGVMAAMNGQAWTITGAPGGRFWSRAFADRT